MTVPMGAAWRDEHTAQSMIARGRERRPAIGRPDRAWQRTMAIISMGYGYVRITGQCEIPGMGSIECTVIAGYVVGTTGYGTALLTWSDDARAWRVVDVADETYDVTPLTPDSRSAAAALRAWRAIAGC